MQIFISWNPFVVINQEPGSSPRLIRYVREMEALLLEIAARPVGDVEFGNS